jgi:23S rRNA pseudouridine2605 synthase
MAEDDLRLQKFLANAGVASRREAEKLISSGKIYVNGRKASLGQKVTPEKDRVTYKGKVVEAEEKITFLFHKPRGFLCNHDGRRDGESIYEHFEELRPYRVAIGLEKNASGLILLTNDGDLLQDIAQNYRRIKRVFSIRVKGQLEEKLLKKLEEKGVQHGSNHINFDHFKETKVEKERTWYECSLFDQRDQLLEKVFLQLQHPIQRIHQIGFGSLRDQLLKKSKGRPLTAKELQQLRDDLEIY